MRFQGKIIKWHDDKGFGFVRANGESKDIFLHIPDIHKLNQRPDVNDLLTYDLIKDEHGRFRAVNVSYLQSEKKVKDSVKPTSFSSIFITFIFFFTVFIIERSAMGYLPHVFPYVFIGINLITFFYYYHDKNSALKNNWRTPESTLHWLSLFGGWAGAYIAQNLFKHKYKKDSFMTIYKLIVLLDCAVTILYSVPKLLKTLGYYLIA